MKKFRLGFKVKAEDSVPRGFEGSIERKGGQLYAYPDIKRMGKKALEKIKKYHATRGVMK